MTLIYDAGLEDKPSTHVFAIGVGSYPHLNGGDEDRKAKNTLSLGQLFSPPTSMKTFVEWFFNPSFGFNNPDAPLSTVRCLASSVSPIQIQTSIELSDPISTANLDNIENEFAAWVDDLKKNENNVGIFYFCGHGIMVENHYLLAEDFGNPMSLKPFKYAFDITMTMRALDREINGSIYYFIDACKEISSELALSLGTGPDSLININIKNRVMRKYSCCLSATGDGKLAYAPLNGQVSRFTNSLLRALSGYCGSRVPGQKFWQINGESLGNSINAILDYEWSLEKNSKNFQICDISTSGKVVSFHITNTKPKVTLSVNLNPETNRHLYKIYAESATTVVSQEWKNECFITDVPTGQYKIGAIHANGIDQDTRPDQDVLPPHYNLVLNG